MPVGGGADEKEEKHDNQELPAGSCFRRYLIIIIVPHG